MGWNLEFTLFEGKTHEYLHPWSSPIPGSNQGKVETLHASAELKLFTRECQALGLVVGLFCPDCLEELFMHVEHPDAYSPALPGASKYYRCPKCDRRWDIR